MCRASLSGSRGWGKSGSAGFWSSRQRDSETARQDYPGCVDNSVTTGRRSSYADEVVETLAKAALLVRERGGEERWETGASKREDGGRTRSSDMGRGAVAHQQRSAGRASNTPARCHAPRRDAVAIGEHSTRLRADCCLSAPKFYPNTCPSARGLLAVGSNMPLATADAYRGAHAARLPHVVLDLGGPRITDAAMPDAMTCPTRAAWGRQGLCGTTLDPLLAPARRLASATASLQASQTHLVESTTEHRASAAPSVGLTPQPHRCCQHGSTACDGGKSFCAPRAGKRRGFPDRSQRSIAPCRYASIDQ